MFEQPGLDLGRRHPDPASLDHVVRPTQAAVCAGVGLLDVGVPGPQPLPLEDSASRLGTAPVAGRQRRTAQVQRPRHAVLHRLVGRLIAQRYVVTGYGSSRRSGYDRASPVGQEDVQRLGRTDPVQDLHPEAIAKPAEQLGRERLAGRDPLPYRGERVVGDVGAEQCGIERGDAEEQRRPLGDHPRGDPGRGRAPGLQHRRGADGQREERRIADPVREEQLGHRQAPVLGCHTKNALPVQLLDQLDVDVPVHRGLGLSGRPGRVQPQGRRVLPGRLRRYGVGSGPEVAPWQDLYVGPQRLERWCRVVRSSIDDDMCYFGRGRDRFCRNHSQLRRQQQHSGTRVGEQAAQLGTGEHRGYRYSHRAHPQHAEDPGQHGRTVHHQEHHPLLGANPERAKGTCRTGGLVGQLRVRPRVGRADHRRTSADSRIDLTVDQVAAGVEDLRHVGVPPLDIKPGERTRIRRAGR